MFVFCLIKGGGSSKSGKSLKGVSKKNIFASPESMLICLGKGQASEVEDSAATCHRYPGSLKPLKFQYLQLLCLRTVYTVCHMRGALGFSGFRFWCPLPFPGFQFFSIWFSVFGKKCKFFFFFFYKVFQFRVIF